MAKINASNLCQDGEFIQRHRRQFTVRSLQHDDVAVYLVIVVSSAMQSVPSPFSANYFTGRSRFPSSEADFDFVLQFDDVARLQVLEDLQRLNVLLVIHLFIRIKRSVASQA